jgi:3-hydroxyisobutyrate dehydrogenase-like beta-hydroxyacid dehydrogenase
MVPSKMLLNRRNSWRSFLTASVNFQRPQTVCFIGFGEAAEALCEGFLRADCRAWDVKLDGVERDSMVERIGIKGIVVADSLEDGVRDADWIVSLVTADQAGLVCQSAASLIKKRAVYLEMNSCSPGTKQRNALTISEAGGVLIDVAIMSPVNPLRMDTPMLMSGAGGDQVIRLFSDFGYVVEIFGEAVGQASAVKMTRSIMIKGIEALSAECLLTAKKLGIEETVIESLNNSFQGLDWSTRGGYNLERMCRHGIRRAAEMREVVNTIEEAGIDSEMTRSTVQWQQRIGEMGLQPSTDDLDEVVNLVLKKMTGFVE